VQQRKKFQPIITKLENQTQKSISVINRNQDSRIYIQCCGAKIISFGSDSGSAEPQIRTAAQAPAPAPAQDTAFFDLT
jgi:hypothetical protein